MAPSYSQLVERNNTYAATHQPLPTIAEIEATGAIPPKTCVVTCVDPRLFPEQFLGLNMGEAFLFRTVGAHPKPALDHILTLDAVSQCFEDLIIIGHTDCGITHFQESEIHSSVTKTAQDAHGDEIEKIETGAISISVEQSVREDIAWLKQQPLMSESLGEKIKGYVFDLKSGKLLPVD